MKKIVSTLSIFLFAIFAVNAQTELNVNQNPNAPEIKFNKLIHDYGKIEKNANGVCEFKFTNTGKEPLILSNVRSSCGCTVPKWPTTPILPGQSDVIQVKYATNRVGKIDKSITVTSNAKSSTVILKITGEVLDTPTDNAPVKQEQGLTPKAQ